MATELSFFLPAGNHPSDEQLLLTALDGDPAAWDEIFNRFESYLGGVVHRRTPDLPPDLQAEVIDEIWFSVHLGGAEAFLESGVPAKHYVASHARGAVDRVRASYRGPGERSRARDARRAPAANGARTSASRAVDIATLPEDLQPEAPSEWDRVDARITLERVMSLAGPDVALAI